MLSAFIAGIALGSWLITRQIFPHVSSYLLFGWAELGIGLSIILTLPVYERLPYFFLKIAWLLNKTPTTFYLFEGIKFLFCFSLLLLPTTFIGMTLPLASRIVTQRPEEVGKKVGSTFSLNTVGNVLGAIATVLVLMSVLGIQTLIAAGVLINLLIGSVIIHTDEKYDLKKKIATSVAISLCFIASIISGSSWDKRVISSGEFRAREMPEYDSYGEYKQAFADQTLLYYKDDNNTTVTVLQDGEKGDRLLKVNGKVDATAKGDLTTQVLLAQLPLCLKPEAKKVLVVGLGSGITVGSALRHEIERLDVVEISSAVVEAERFFQSYNYNPLQNLRLHLQIEDAKSALKLTPCRFDVIISEPSNPWIAGIGNLFSVEFYREALAHLKEDGIIVQWVQLYEMSNDVFKMILRTFTSVFRHVTMWEIGNDVLLLGSPSLIEVDFQSLEAVLNQSKVQTDLHRIKINTLATLLSLQLASDKTVREMSGNGPINSDLLPLLEYHVPKAFFLDIESDLAYFHDERLFPIKNSRHLLSMYLSERKYPLSQSELKDMVEFHKENETNIAKGLIVEWARRFPTDPEALWARSQLERDENDLESARRTLDKLIEIQPDNPLYLEAAADVHFEVYFENQTFLTDVRPERVITYYQRLIDLKMDSHAHINFKLAQVYEAVHEYRKALHFLETAVKNSIGDEEKELTLDTIWIAAAKVARKMDNPKMALDYARKAVNYDQDNEEAHAILKGLSAIELEPVVIENEKPKKNKDTR
jgi:spermidine synthase